MPAKTRLAQLIARQEGFGIPGAKPTRDHNPGDLEHAPHIEAWDGKIGIEPSDDAGWADLERQIQLYASRGMTIQHMIEIYAPPSENATESYLDFICKGLGCEPGDSVADVSQIPAAAGL
jgi:DNA-binding Xre family transcriptional regulator